MGLREKVALVITLIVLIQVTSSSKNKSPQSKFDKTNQKRSLVTQTLPLNAKSTYPNKYNLKSKSKPPSDASQEAIRKAFRFPDIEYPTAPLQRSQFYLQDTNAQQGNPVQLSTSSLSPNNISNKSQKYNYKNYLTKLKTKQSTGIPKTYAETSSTAKPFCFVDETFQEVEYPLNAWETWKPNYWPLTPILDQKQNDLQSNSYSQGAKKSNSCINTENLIKKSKDNVAPVPAVCVNAESTVSLAMPDEFKCDKNIEKNDICFKTSNQTLTIKTLTDVRNDDSSCVSQFKIPNDDKTTVVSRDNKITSIADVSDTVLFESSDNKDSCFEDNASDSNKSLALDVDEEFTTDVLPDFDDDMWYVSTSTMSPISFVDINEAWANHVIEDPLSESEPDELEAYYILLP